MSETVVLLIGMVISVAAGVIAGATVTSILYELRSGNTWRRLRHHYRPLLWHFGLDWPEIKRTYKRVFMFYYLRRLPASSLESPSSASSDDGALDESGDISPGTSLPMNETTEPQF
jgi:hypothetical protein